MCTGCSLYHTVALSLKTWKDFGDLWTLGKVGFPKIAYDRRCLESCCRSCAWVRLANRDNTLIQSIGNGTPGCTGPLDMLIHLPRILPGKVCMCCRQWHKSLNAAAVSFSVCSARSRAIQHPSAGLSPSPKQSLRTRLVEPGRLANAGLFQSIPCRR